MKYAAVPAGEALRKASQELQKTKSYKTFAAKPEAAVGVGAFLFATVIALAAPKPAKIVAPPPPPEPVVVAAPSLDLTKVKLPDVDVSRYSRVHQEDRRVQGQGPRRVYHRRLQGIGSVGRCGQEDERGRVEGDQQGAADAGPAIGAFTTDVAVPALKYGADETSKAASAAASQVAVEAAKVDWAGLAEECVGADGRSLLVYVPVFAYTFAASLPAEEQFVLGLVVILVVGSFAKQDGESLLPARVRARQTTDTVPGYGLRLNLMIKAHLALNRPSGAAKPFIAG